MEGPPPFGAKIETVTPHVFVTDTWMVVASLLLGKNESPNSPVCFLWHHLSRDREDNFPIAEWRNLCICPCAFQALHVLSTRTIRVGGSLLSASGGCCPAVLLGFSDTTFTGMLGCLITVSWDWESRFLTWHWLDQMEASPQFVWDAWLQKSSDCLKVFCLLGCPFAG